MSAKPSSRDGHFNPTSPHSSSGAADSFKGTPETRLTVFSPEDGSTKSSKAPQSLSVRSQENRNLGFTSNTPGAHELPASFVRSELFSERDPFVSSSGISASEPQKLSATASVFMPLPSTLAPSPLNNNQTAESVGQQKDNGTTGQNTDQQLISVSGQAKFYHRNISTESGVSRCIIIADPGRQLRAHDIGSFLSDLESQGLKMFASRKICEDQKAGDRVYVRFDNIRDSISAYAAMSRMTDRDWFANYYPVQEYVKVVEPTATFQTAHEGQVYLNVFSTAMASHVPAGRIEESLKTTLGGQGDLFAFKSDLPQGAVGSLFSAIAEYAENAAAIHAVATLNNTILEGGFQLCIALYRPDVDQYNPAHSGVMSPARLSTAGSDMIQDFQRLSMSRTLPNLPTLGSANSLVTTPVRPSGLQMQPTYGMLPVVYHGVPMATPPYVLDTLAPRPHHPAALPSSMTFPCLGPLTRSPYTPRDMGTPRHYPGINRRQNATRIARSPHYQQANNHNHVDINRIREGTDVRTTIMLRNIPNKVDQVMLKNIVDESSWGKYDFMYLRIDFANDCNVGYAFINFVDPLDIIDFVHARGNQRWNCFKSDKVAEISYATIQGKDCLVQKFRNSSVMLELPHYRPKLYYTLNGPCPDFAGEEEAFPGPDNQSKMKRSCENAEHVGLFTPNAGQHFRDEVRRRRSQFDRGTRMAEAEEYDYGASNMHHNFYSS